MLSKNKQRNKKIVAFIDELLKELDFNKTSDEEDDDYVDEDYVDRYVEEYCNKKFPEDGNEFFKKLISRLIIHIMKKPYSGIKTLGYSEIREIMKKNIIALTNKTQFAMQIPCDTLTSNICCSKNFLSKPGRYDTINCIFYGLNPHYSLNTDGVKYGFLSPNCKFQNNLNHYGDVMLIFKKDRVIDRTTFTFGDSLLHKIIPSPISSPSLCSFSKYPRDLIKRGYTGNFEKLLNVNILSGYGKKYIELQYNGELTVDDVECIVLPFEKKQIQNYILNRSVDTKDKINKNNSNAIASYYLLAQALEKHNIYLRDCNGEKLTTADFTMPFDTVPVLEKNVNKNYKEYRSINNNEKLIGYFVEYLKSSLITKNTDENFLKNFAAYFTDAFLDTLVHVPYSSTDNNNTFYLPIKLLDNDTQYKLFEQLLPLLKPTIEFFMPFCKTHGFEIQYNSSSNYSGIQNIARNQLSSVIGQLYSDNIGKTLTICKLPLIDNMSDCEFHIHDVDTVNIDELLKNYPKIRLHLHIEDEKVSELTNITKETDNPSPYYQNIKNIFTSFANHKNFRYDELKYSITNDSTINLNDVITVHCGRKRHLVLEPLRKLQESIYKDNNLRVIINVIS